MAGHLAVAEQIVADERFLLQKGIRAAIEPEAAEYKSRAAIEHKFGELKNTYRLARARYRGLIGVFKRC